MLAPLTLLRIGLTGLGIICRRAMKDVEHVAGA
jgi:hypothetical protein